jgi:hypothetical protein
MTTTGKNRIMIYGPKDDGTYVVEFKTAAGEVLAISIRGRRGAWDCKPREHERERRRDEPVGTNVRRHDQRICHGRGDCRRDRLRSHDVDVAAQGSRGRHGRTAERACAGARALVEAQRVR